MDYEIRIWNDPKKMPKIEPKKAAGRLEGMVSSIKSTVKKLKGAKSSSNPDILIDKDGGGDDVIKSVEISYVTKEIDSTGFKNTPIKKKVRVIKMDIKGNLYLPLKEDGITGAAKSMIGLAKDENKIRDTLLLSKWASVLPENELEEHFYRGIVVSVLTKAGDFRVITAKKVYVESYTENYKEGEFGTFTLSLIEKVDSNKDFKVAGLGYEKISAVKSVGNKLEKAAKVVTTTGAVIAGVGAVGKAVTETVEKFTGETAATRWIKYGFDTAGVAGNVANSASNIIKKPKDVKTWTDELIKVNKNVEDRIKKGIETKSGKKSDDEKPSDDEKIFDDEKISDDDKKTPEEKPSDDEKLYDDDDKTPEEKPSDDEKISDDDDKTPDEKPSDDEKISDDDDKTPEEKPSDDDKISDDDDKTPEEKPSDDDKISDDDDKTPEKKPSDDDKISDDDDKTPEENPSDDDKISDDDDKTPEEKPSEDNPTKNNSTEESPSEDDPSDDNPSDEKSPSTAKSDLNTLISSAANKKNGGANGK